MTSAETVTSRATALRALQEIPGIGTSIARDLYVLGMRKPTDLRCKSPEALYAHSNRLAGVQQDRCLLYTFRCAVYYASRRRHDPEKLKWWNWSDSNLSS